MTVVREQQVDDGYSTRGCEPRASAISGNEYLRVTTAMHRGVNVVGMVWPPFQPFGKGKCREAQCESGGAREGHSPCSGVTCRTVRSLGCSTATSGIVYAVSGGRGRVEERTPRRPWFRPRTYVK